MQRFFRLLAGCLRGLLGLCALSLMLLALYVSLGRELVPMVAAYRPDLEAQARETLGMPVSVGSLEGGWAGFSPLLVAHDLLLGEGAGALRLDHVRMRPDLLQSLLARRLRIDSLEFEGLKLSLREDEQGKWSLVGLPSREPRKPLDPSVVLKGLEQIASLSLLDSQLTLEPHGQAPFTLTQVNLSLSNAEGQQRLDGHLRLPDGLPLSWSLRTRLDAQDWLQSQAEFYLSLPQSDWAAWLPRALTRDWHLERLRAGGELWLSWADAGLQRGVIRLHAPELVGNYAERPPVSLQDLAVTGYFQRNGADFRVLLDSLAATLGPTRWGEVQVGVEHRASSALHEEQWAISADRLHLPPIASVVQAMAPLPKTAANLLAGLQPRGTLRNIELFYKPQASASARLSYAANLDRVAFNAFGGVPAAENVSGSVVGDLGAGELRLDAPDAILHLANVFPRPWHYRHVGGRLLWHIDEEAVTLIAPYLQTQGEEGNAAGDFLIRLRRDPAEEDYMDLRVGMRDGDASYTEKYLPTALSPDLAGWLKTAIRSGRVDEGYFLYQGSLNKGALDTARSLGLFFKIQGTELDYRQGWPGLHEARGEVFVEDSGVRVRLSSGRILDSQVTAAQADIPLGRGVLPRLQLKGELDSSIGEGLRFVREAPLKGASAIFVGWEGEGALKGGLSLDIPLRRDERQPPLGVQIALTTSGARLKIAQAKLQLEQLQGNFDYDIARGLSSKDARAQIFGQPVRAEAIAEGSNGQPLTRIRATGRVSWPALSEWLSLTQTLPLSGELPYRLDLSLDGQDSLLTVDSDLRGLRIDLPEPLGKPEQVARQSHFRMTLDTSTERHYRLDYGDLASLAMAAPQGQLVGGRAELRLGGQEAELPVSEGLWVRGSLESLEWDAWREVLAPLTPVTLGSGQQAEASPPWLRGAELQIGHFQGGGLTLSQLSASLTPASGGWQLDLNSPQAKGRILVPKGKSQPIDADLEYLVLQPPASTGAVSEQGGTPPYRDPLARIDPRQIPPLDVRIKSLQRGAEQIGAWSFKARPSADGVGFSELDLDLKGLRVSGNAGWEGRPGSGSSWYKGRVRGGDLAPVLKAWGFAPSTTSKRFRVDVDGRWPGSPAAMHIERYSGSLDFSLRKGQFLEVDGSAARVFGLLNFDAIGRRLRLDFSDLFGRGLSYDEVKGLLDGHDGVFATRTPITMEGPSNDIEMEGTLDLPSNRIDARLRVTLPISSNVMAVLLVGAPAVGGALFVVDKLLGNRVSRFASVKYRVEGSWQEPKITYDKPF